VEVLYTWQILIFTLSIFILTHFVRRIIEALVPTIRKDTPLSFLQNVWDKVLLPALPIIVGSLEAAMAKSWPWPPGLSKWTSRALLGMVLGFFSTWFYMIAKSIIKDKFKVDLDAPVVIPAMVPGKPAAPPADPPLVP
jgi:hypothetical protein